jgi:hypothetical protein
MNKTGAKKREPWERSPNESIKAYTAAKTYFDLGADRSLAAAAKRLNKSVGQMKRWSVTHRWKSRAIAYDRWCNQIKQEAKEQQIRRTAQLWTERAEKHREDDYQISLKLRKKASDMLNYPLVKTTIPSPDGMSITTIEPALWNMSHAARLAEAASHLGSKAVGTAQASSEIVEPDDEFKLVPYKGDVR